MSYTLNYGKDGNTTLTVPDGQSGTVANLTFPGRNFSGYGSPVDQNFLSLAENFASANIAGPQYAIAGQLWYDIANSSTAISNSYQGLKINTSTTASPSWTNFVTFDKPGAALNSAGTPIAINPNNISNIGTLTATTGSLVNLTVSGNTTSNNVTIGNALLASTGNFTSSIVTPSANITTITSTTANVSGAVSTGALTITGNINQKGTGLISYFDGDISVNNVTIRGNTTSLSGTATTYANSLIELSTFSGTPANTNKDVGVLYHYAVSTTDNQAFLGFQNSTGNFILLRNADMPSTGLNSGVANIANSTWGNLDLRGVNATIITATTINGNLANGTSNVSIPLAGGNINLYAGNASAGNATVNITGFDKITSANTTWTAANAALAVTGAGFISGNLRVAGKIYGELVSPATSTANIPSANIASANISGTANITTGNITTVNSATVNSTSTATLNQLLVNTSAQVQSFVSNTSIASATLTANSGITATGNSALTATNFTAGANTTAGYITGAWTLTAGSTLEATYSADLAERHHADAQYPTGSVMTVGGTNEITGASTTSKVLGVVSDAWAYLMNGGAGPQETHPAVAYVGRVPVRILGPINKHDEVSPFANGVATSSKENSFGWALETNLDAGEKLVLCIVK